MNSKSNPAKGEGSGDSGATALERLAALTRRIVTVPREEVDEQAQAWKQRQKRKGNPDELNESPE